MMELIVAILMSLGALTTNGDLSAYSNEQISAAQEIIDNGQYRINEADGGVVVEPGVGL